MVFQRILLRHRLAASDQPGRSLSLADGVVPVAAPQAERQSPATCVLSGPKLVTSRLHQRDAEKTASSMLSLTINRLQGGAIRNWPIEAHLTLDAGAPTESSTGLGQLRAERQRWRRHDRGAVVGSLWARSFPPPLAEGTTCRMPAATKTLPTTSMKVTAWIARNRTQPSARTRPDTVTTQDPFLYSGPASDSLRNTEIPC
jgi:hypothetical protein